MLITGIAGAGMYVMKLRADNATLKSNQLKLETAIEDQTKLLEQQKADFKAIMERKSKEGKCLNIRQKICYQLKMLIRSHKYKILLNTTRLKI